MKTNQLITMAALLLVFFTSCSKDDKTVATGITAAQVNNNTATGNWQVTLYNENGSVDTSDFSGYAFVFNADGTLVATNTPTVKNGTWVAAPDSGAVKFTIDFTATEADGPFESISEDWTVLNSSTTKIELKHVSGGDGSIDLLTFEKI